MTGKAVKKMPVIDMVQTGQNIKQMRIAAGMSVKDIQDIFGFASGNAIYKWQDGKCMPTIDNLVVLAQIFHTTIDAIIVVKR